MVEADEVRTLYRAVIDAWNARDAARFADAFTDDAVVIGFDGSSMDGRADVKATLARIFADHPNSPRNFTRN